MLFIELLDLAKKVTKKLEKTYNKVEFFVEDLGLTSGAMLGEHMLPEEVKLHVRILGKLLSGYDKVTYVRIINRTDKVNFPITEKSLFKIYEKLIFQIYGYEQNIFKELHRMTMEKWFPFYKNSFWIEMKNGRIEFILKMRRKEEFNMPEEVKEVNAEVLEQDIITDDVFYQIVAKPADSKTKAPYLVYGIHRTKQPALSDIHDLELSRPGTKYYLIKIDLRENVKPSATPIPSNMIDNKSKRG